MDNKCRSNRCVIAEANSSSMTASTSNYSNKDLQVTPSPSSTVSPLQSSTAQQQHYARRRKEREITVEDTHVFIRRRSSDDNNYDDSDDDQSDDDDKNVNNLLEMLDLDDIPDLPFGPPPTATSPLMDNDDSASSPLPTLTTRRRSKSPRILRSTTSHPMTETERNERDEERRKARASISTSPQSIVELI